MYWCCDYCGDPESSSFEQDMERRCLVAVAITVAIQKVAQSKVEKKRGYCLLAVAIITLGIQKLAGSKKKGG